MKEYLLSIQRSIYSLNCTINPSCVFEYVNEDSVSQLIRRDYVIEIVSGVLRWRQKRFFCFLFLHFLLTLAFYYQSTLLRSLKKIISCLCGTKQPILWKDGRFIFTWAIWISLCLYGNCGQEDFSHLLTTYI